MISKINFMGRHYFFIEIDICIYICQIDKCSKNDFDNAISFIAFLYLFLNRLVSRSMNKTMHLFVV